MPFLLRAIYLEGILAKMRIPSNQHFILWVLFDMDTKY